MQELIVSTPQNEMTKDYVELNVNNLTQELRYYLIV